MPKIIFIPRRIVPHLDMSIDQSTCTRKLILPTKEYVLFDALTKEVKIIYESIEELSYANVVSTNFKKTFACSIKINSTAVHQNFLPQGILYARRHNLFY